MLFKEKVQASIDASKYISRDLSWIQFNHRVLDQAKNENRTILERLKFLAITASNLDEFFMIRVGSLYNYLDYNKQRVDYSGLREGPFRLTLFSELQEFVKDQYKCFNKMLQPLFASNNFRIGKLEDLTEEESKEAGSYFKKTIFPMLTPMLTDAYRTFPLLMNKLLVFGIVTLEEDEATGKEQKRLSFVQIPQNLPRFYEVMREDELIFVPIEEIIRPNIKRLYRNVEIISTDLFRITRNGDYSLEESEDIEVKFIDELKRKLKSRRTGRVVRIEMQPGYSKWVLKKLRSRWDIEEDNIFEVNGLLDFSSLWQIIGHEAFRYHLPEIPDPVTPVTLSEEELAASDSIFQKLKKQDILLHHPFNSMELLLDMLEEAAEDPNVLAIKMTIYRVASNSRVTKALLKAAENGKHVSALFEVKARFDEENNMQEAKRLETAGCFVIYGVSSLKTHTKMLLIVRKEQDKITRYVHMGSGNYNEKTAKLYTDLGLLSSHPEYAHDVSEFFNAITGHSKPKQYQHLLTAPINMRRELIELIEQEATNAQEGKSSGIVIKINSLQDDKVIDALYKASAAGVPVRLIVRGICCIRPRRKKLSENIQVRSLVGDFLEHSRIYYFHNEGNPKVFGGSADVMVRSFDRRIESLFEFIDEKCKQEVINILLYNFKDNVNAYEMQEDGSYVKLEYNGSKAFNSHVEFFEVSPEDITNEISLF